MCLHQHGFPAGALFRGVSAGRVERERCRCLEHLAAGAASSLPADPQERGATFLRGSMPTESLYFIYGVCDFGSRKKKGRKLLCFSACAAANRPRPQACDAQVVNIIGQQGPWWGHSRLLSPPCAVLSPPAPAARGKSNPTASAAAAEEETAENQGGHVRAAAASAPRPRSHWVKRLLFWGEKRLLERGSGSLHGGWGEGGYRAGGCWDYCSSCGALMENGA